MVYLPTFGSKQCRFTRLPQLHGAQECSMPTIGQGTGWFWIYHISENLEWRSYQIWEILNVLGCSEVNKPKPSVDGWHYASTGMYIHAYIYINTHMPQSQSWTRQLSTGCLVHHILQTHRNRRCLERWRILGCPKFTLEPTNEVGRSPLMHTHICMYTQVVAIIY